jgi:hypothetical protein
MQDCVHGLDTGPAAEWRRAGHHLLEHDAEREDVTAMVDGDTRCLLRRHVRRGADDHS